MITRNTFQVLHMTRSIGPTSMPWNDLYNYQIESAPEIMSTPLAVTSIFGRLREKEAPCRGFTRSHYSAGLISAIQHVRKLYKELRQKNQNLILHIHNPSLAPIAIFTKIICPGIIIIANLHTDWRFLRPHQRFLLGELARCSNRFITVSEAIVQTIPPRILNKLKRFNRLVSISNGIDSIALGSMDGLSRNKREPGTAIVVARIVPAKNASYVLDILEASSSLKKIIWLGGGPQMEFLQEEVQRRGLEDQIELRGQCTRQKVFESLSRASVYISASLWEGIGVANLEAAALGAYPFLSAIPAHKEIAETLGFSTFPLDNPGAWALGIEEFLKLPEDKKEERRNSLREKVLMIYDIRQIIGRYIDVYKDTVIGKI